MEQPRRALPNPEAREACRAHSPDHREDVRAASDAGALPGACLKDQRLLVLASLLRCPDRGGRGARRRAEAP
jgi:hypothetical protein